MTSNFTPTTPFSATLRVGAKWDPTQLQQSPTQRAADRAARVSPSAHRKCSTPPPPPHTQQHRHALRTRTRARTHTHTQKPRGPRHPQVQGSRATAAQRHTDPGSWTLPGGPTLWAREGPTNTQRDADTKTPRDTCMKGKPEAQMPKSHVNVTHTVSHQGPWQSCNDSSSGI